MRFQEPVKSNRSPIADGPSLLDDMTSDFFLHLCVRESQQQDPALERQDSNDIYGVETVMYVHVPGAFRPFSPTAIS